MHVEDFTGRGASVKGLCEGFLAGAPVHAALLVGPAGVGKRTLVDTLAQSLFCTGPEPKPCGTCPGCRRFLAGSHPDVHRIEEKKRIGVEEIRELITALHAAAYEGGYRVAILECAGNMTPQAQNSLLKTLEEPPSKTVFFLTAISGSQLLPTIRSRCQVVQVPPLPRAQVEQALMQKGLEASRASELAGMAQGSIGEALKLDADTGFWTLRNKIFSAMQGVRGPGDVLMALNALKDDKADAQRVCDIIEGALRNAMVACLEGLQPQDTAWPMLTRMDARSLATMMEKVRLMRQMLASNVSWQAVLERFLLEYSEDIHRWQS